MTKGRTKLISYIVGFYQDYGGETESEFLSPLFRVVVRDSEQCTTGQMNQISDQNSNLAHAYIEYFIT